MRKLFFLFIISSLLIVSNACKPKAPEVNPEYVGTWYGYDNTASYSITISQTGVANYEKFSGILTVMASGKARVKGNKFKIGVKKFYLNQEPTLVNDNGYIYYQMVLDDVLYERY